MNALGKNNLLFSLVGLVILVVVNLAIYQKEQLLSHGQIIYLQLAPIDPRSLMQGDYMRLQYKIGASIEKQLNSPRYFDGMVLVNIDEQGLATFAMLADAQTTAKTNQRLLQFRYRDHQVKFATNAFFFEEGEGEKYQNARYGVFRLADDGQLLLTDLVDHL